MTNFLFVLVSLFSSTLVIDPCEADLREIVAQVASSYQITRYLNSYGHDAYFRFETMPHCNKRQMLPLKSAIRYKQSTGIIQYSGDKNLEKKDNDAVVLDIDSLWIEGTNAVVKIRIPKEGVYGNFTLSKRATWVINSVEMVER